MCLGDLSSTPLLLLENPTLNSTLTDQQDESTTKFIQCQSFPSDSSSSLSESATSEQSQQVMNESILIKILIRYFS